MRYIRLVYTLFMSQLAENWASIALIAFYFFTSNSRFDYKCEIGINLRAMYVLSTFVFRRAPKSKKKLDKNIYVNYDVIR